MRQFALVLLLCTMAFASRSILGKCPKMEVFQNFDVNQYLGTWYEYGRYFVPLELGGKCNVANYSLSENEAMKIVISQVNTLTGSTNRIEGIAKAIGKKGDARFSVTFPSSPVQIKGYYSILNTDYTKFSILYTCQEIGLYHISSAWIVTRERFPEEEVVEAALEIFVATGLKKKYLIKTNQDDCE